MPLAGIAVAAGWEESEHSANAAAPALRQIKGLDFIVVLPSDWLDRIFRFPHPQFAKPLHPEMRNSFGGRSRFLTAKTLRKPA
jgi:hypothetical protein